MWKKATAPLSLAAGLLVLTIVLSGCGVRGSGDVVSEQRQVSGFDRINVSGRGKLIITQGSAEGITVEAEDNIIGKIETAVEGGVLKIGERGGWFGGIWPRKDIVFRVTAKELKEVTFSGSGEISGQNTIETNELTVKTNGSGKVDIAVRVQKLVVDINGSGTVTLSGTAEQVKLDSSGSGTFHARQLAARDAEVRISGSGKVEVNAKEKLIVNISGSGRVAYEGNPTVESHISGSGQLDRLTQ